MNYNVKMTRLWHRISFVALVSISLTLSLSLARGGTAELRGFFPAHAKAERDLELKFRSIPDAAHAESSLRHLTSQPHMAGSGMVAAIEATLYLLPVRPGRLGR